MQSLLLLCILQTAASAFTRKVPYFEDQRSDEKWYWDDDDTKMKTVKDPNKRNTVYISFDETAQELSIGSTKCLALENDDFLKIVSKSEGCEKFTYKFETLTVANTDLNAREVCMKNDPTKVNYKLVLQQDCDNFKLYFENVVRVSYKLYVNQEDTITDAPKNNPEDTVTVIDTTTTLNSLTSTRQTTIIAGQETKTFSKPSETSPIKDSNTKESTTTDSVYTGSSSSDVDAYVITTQDYSGSSVFSTTTTSSEDLPSSSPGILKSSKSASFVPDISSSPGPSVTQTQIVRTDSSTPSNKNKNSNMDSEFKDRAQPSASSSYVLKGYYIDECILKQIENMDDTECFMECLNIYFCRSFTHSSKNRCIIYSCIIDNMNPKKVDTINENHAYYK